MLVTVVTLGLAQLAVRTSRAEFMVAAGVVAALALPVALASPPAGLALVFAALGAARLAVPAVPDTVPADWD